MKLFQIVQRNFAYVGISPNQAYWNEKSAKAVFIFSSFTVLGTAFLLYDANTFLEYTMNIYETTAVFGTGIVFLSMLFQKEKLFKSIEKLEKFVDKSEYREKNNFLCTSLEMFWTK